LHQLSKVDLWQLTPLHDEPSLLDHLTCALLLLYPKTLRRNIAKTISERQS